MELHERAQQALAEERARKEEQEQERRRQEQEQEQQRIRPERERMGHVADLLDAMGASWYIGGGGRVYAQVGRSLCGGNSHIFRVAYFKTTNDAETWWDIYYKTPYGEFDEEYSAIGIDELEHYVLVCYARWLENEEARAALEAAPDPEPDPEPHTPYLHAVGATDPQIEVATRRAHERAAPYIEAGWLPQSVHLALDDDGYMTQYTIILYRSLSRAAMGGGLHDVLEVEMEDTDAFASHWDAMSYNQALVAMREEPHA